MTSHKQAYLLATRRVSAFKDAIYACGSSNLDTFRACYEAAPAGLRASYKAAQTELSNAEYAAVAAGAAFRNSIHSIQWN